MNRITKGCLAVVVLMFVMGLMTTANGAEAKGKLKAVFPDKNEFILESPQGNERTFQLDKIGKVFINNNEAKLADLQPGEEVTVVYELRMELAVASEVRCIRFDQRFRK